MTAIAILHPTNLQGKELRETIEARHPGWTDIRLLSTREDEIGTLTEAAGAAALVNRYEPEALEGVDLAFLCGTAEENRPILGELPAGATAILLSPDATLEDGVPVVAGVNSEAAHGRRTLVSPHPAAVILAHLLSPLREFAPTEAVATLMQPASMKGQAGLEELFENSRQIVAMTSRTSTPVFGTQLAFNVLPASAEAAGDQLHTVLAGAPPVTLQILQGGVFHGVAASLLVRCPSNPTLAAFRKALGENPVLEAAVKPRLLGPVDAAGSDKVILGSLRKDETGAFWLWAVMDNLTRGGALNALEIAEAVLQAPFLQAGK
ncbi:MAG TPA: Asd/ArgC dimerization domain-containing protein [Thermoanaerobaculia bacterium]|nr:Asd/ArgC dimerization domain-containing protein [Thermoanaerobaculia bacterium]